MNTLRALFEKKDKKVIYYLIAVFIAGLLLLILNGGTRITPEGSSTTLEEKAVTQEMEDSSYENTLEKRLEAALSQVEGVGRVKVMITLAYGREAIVGTDSVTSQSNSKETDAGGGSRETYTNSNEDKTIIITDKGGDNKPLILKEVEPKVEGVIIVAEGGDDIFIKDALIKAAATVLGIEVNKVQILKMKPR